MGPGSAPNQDLTSCGDTRCTPWQHDLPWPTRSGIARLCGLDAVPLVLNNCLGHLVPELVYSLDPTRRMSRPSNWCANHGDGSPICRRAPIVIPVQLHTG
jgi:hypothetical protein